MSTSYKINRHDDNIEKIFYSDIKEKKRIGSNIFNRVSTRKGGTTQALKTPYYYMSRKEKKELNGEVTVTNVYSSLMSKEELETYGLEKQKQIMENWRKNHKVNDIIDALGMSRQGYYDKLKELGIKVVNQKDRHQKKIALSEEELEDIKNNLVDYNKFMSIPTHQRHEVTRHYSTQFSPKELAEYWGIKTSMVYNHRYRADKYFEELEKHSSKEKTDTIAILPQTKEENTLRKEVSNISQNEENVVKISSSESDSKENSFYFTVNQNGKGQSIINKLRMLIGLLEESEDSEEFELSITVQK